MISASRTCCLLLFLITITACNRSLQTDALRRIRPYQWGVLRRAAELKDADRQQLVDAIDQSLAWFETRESRKTYPVGDFKHRHAHASLFAFRELLSIKNSRTFVKRVLHEFDLYMSIGAKTSGYVQFTGYFAPQFAGSRTKDDTYRFPLYKRPVNLKTPFATRSEIDADPAKFKLAGTEIVYLKDQFDAFVIHVNGSAKIDLPDGRSINVGHDGTNERPYTSLGKLLIANKAIPRDKISMQAIRAYFQENPGEFNGYLHQNDRYVFFRELNEKWPLGSLGIKLTPLRSIATDKTMFPPGAIALALTSLPTIKKKEDDPASRSFVQYVLDQDSGGAIKSPGRVDIFIGVGKEAGEVAGQTISKGRLIYPLLKTDRISHWLKQMKSKAGAS